jgi:hypothetical protein
MEDLGREIWDGRSGMELSANKFLQALMAGDGSSSGGGVVVVVDHSAERDERAVDVEGSCNTMLSEDLEVVLLNARTRILSPALSISTVHYMYNTACPEM